MRIVTQTDQWPTRCADTQPHPSGPAVGSPTPDTNFVFCHPPLADYNWHCDGYDDVTGRVYQFEHPEDMTGLW